MIFKIALLVSLVLLIYFVIALSKANQKLAELKQRLYQKDKELKRVKYGKNEIAVPYLLNGKKRSLRIK